MSTRQTIRYTFLFLLISSLFIGCTSFPPVEEAESILIIQIDYSNTAGSSSNKDFYLYFSGGNSSPLKIRPPYRKYKIIS